LDKEGNQKTTSSNYVKSTSPDMPRFSQDEKIRRREEDGKQ